MYCPSTAKKPNCEVYVVRMSLSPDMSHGLPTQPTFQPIEDAALRQESQHRFLVPDRCRASCLPQQAFLLNEFLVAATLYWGIRHHRWVHQQEFRIDYCFVVADGDSGALGSSLRRSGRCLTGLGVTTITNATTMTCVQHIRVDAWPLLAAGMTVHRAVDC